MHTAAQGSLTWFWPTAVAALDILLSDFVFPKIASVTKHKRVQNRLTDDQPPFRT